MERKRHSNKGFVIILLILVLLIAFFAYKDKIKEQIATKLATAATEKLLEQETGQKVSLNKVISKMDEKDATETKSILNKYANSETVSECVKKYKEGNVSEVKAYLKEK